MWLCKLKNESKLSAKIYSSTANVIATKLEIGRDKARQEGKPEAMLDKIAEGRLNKFYQESTLLNALSKMVKITVQNYLKQANKDLTVTDFKRVTLTKSAS